MNFPGLNIECDPGDSPNYISHFDIYILTNLLYGKEKNNMLLKLITYFSIKIGNLYIQKLSL